MKYHNNFTLYIGLLILSLLIYLFLQQELEAFITPTPTPMDALGQSQTYYDGYKTYLKENTNTTYDEYVGQERLFKEDSASAHIRNQKPVPKDIAEDKTLLTYFIDLFNKDSITIP